MNVQEIQEEIRKNLEAVRSNVDGLVNYVASPEFRQRAEQASQKLIDLASTTSRDALKLAKEVSEKAVSNANELRSDVTARAQSLVEELRGSANEILSNLRKQGEDKDAAA